MLITDKNELKKYGTPYRIWQGIPGIEVTRKGRIFSTFYSGGKTEEVNNFALLLKSDDGVNFGEPIAVAFREGYRCYDPCLWIDPVGRLWFIWAVAPEHAVYAAVCDNPDADELAWSEPFKIGAEVMMNKPTVLTTGEWLFPIAVWHSGVCAGGFESKDEDRKAFAYKTVDRGKTFVKMGGADIYRRSFDEHMILELNDGRLAMFIRTTYGIGVAYSFDRGKTWTKGEKTTLGGPCSRFFIRRLKSGRILLINHYNWTGRNNLTAMLSEDEGKTWKYHLLLDERKDVSYPDAKEADDGYIYITYDRDRGGYTDSLDKVYASAREVLYAKITEEDIIRGKLVGDESRLKCVISKLDKYALEVENPFGEATRLPMRELVKHIADMGREEMLAFLFDHYGVNCANMHMLENRKLDALIEELDREGCDREEILGRIILLVRSVTDAPQEEIPMVARIKSMIQETLPDELPVREIAERMGMSMYYMCHLFKEKTGITIVDYKKELKIVSAKQLLVNTDKKITEIAQECGFGSDSYFCKVFLECEMISPAQYRAFSKQ